MEHFKLPEESETQLRKLIEAEIIGDKNEFRIFLTIITGERFPHNHTPIRETMEFGDREIITSRLYLDGLIARVSDRNSTGFPFAESDAFDVGYRNNFSVFTVDGLKSRQFQFNREVFEDSARIRSESANV